MRCSLEYKRYALETKVLAFRFSSGIIKVMRKTIRYAVLGFTFVMLVPVCAVADYSIILKRNIFAEPSPPPEPEVIEKKSILKPLPPPSLVSLIDLKGIIYFPDGDSFAVISVKKNNEEVVCKEGEVILDAEIVRVSENEVVFAYNGKEEKIELKKESGQAGFVAVTDTGLSARVEDAKKIVNPAVSDIPEFEKPVTVDFEKTMAELKNDKDLLKNLNVSPNVQEGKVEGFKINNIPAGSLPYQYGLRNGDVLRRVNGVFIDSMATGFSVYNQIVKDGTDLVTVEVLRNNSPIVLTFRLR